MVVNLSLVKKKYILLSSYSRKKCQQTLRGHFWTFSIVRMPHTSNMPSKMFDVRAYGAEVLRIARVKITKTGFISYCSILISRMIDQGGNVNTLS